MSDHARAAPTLKRATLSTALIDAIEQRPGACVAGLTAVAFVTAVVTASLPPTLPIDLMEGFIWGRSFELGYYKHPPLQAWLLGAAERIAPGQWWLGFVIGQICVAIAIWAVWRLARSLLGPPLGAIAAALTLAGVFYYGVPSATLTPDTLTLPLWALTLLHYWRAVGERRQLYWFALAIDAALFVYAKYVGVLLFGVLAWLTLLTPEGRAALRRPAPWAAVVLCLVLASPHLWWLYDHAQALAYPLEFRYPAESWLQRVWFTLKFYVAQIINHGGLGALLLILLWPARTPPQLVFTQQRLSGFALTFVMVASCAPITVVLIFNLWSGVEFRHGWGNPLFALSAVFMLVLLRPWLELRRLAAAARLALALIIVPHVVNASVAWLDTSDGRTAPAKEAARALTDEFRQRTGQPLRIVVGDRNFAGPVVLYSPDRPKLFIEANYSRAPWITPELVRDQGALIAWSAKLHPDTLSWYRDVKGIGPRQQEGTVSFPWNNRARTPSLELGFTVVPPQR